MSLTICSEGVFAGARTGDNREKNSYRRLLNFREVNRGPHFIGWWRRTEMCVFGWGKEVLRLSNRDRYFKNLSVENDRDLFDF